ncbi:MAG TPA: CHAT domain-containing protein [Thermoanaerobaculia bacterium]
MKRLLLLLLFVLPVIAQASAPEDVAAAFREVLLRDDRALLAHAALANEDDREALFELRDVIDRHDCIEITRYEWSTVSETAEAVTLRIDVRGHGVLKGTTRREVPLFPRWHVDAKLHEGRWKIARVRTEEGRIAALMVAAPTTAEAHRIFLDARDVDPIEVIELYADGLEVRGELAPLTHALELAQATGDQFLEVFVRRMQLIVASVQPDWQYIRDAIPALETLAHHGDRPDVRAEAWFTSASAHFLLQEMDAAIPRYRAAIDEIDLVDDPVRPLKSLYMHVWVLQQLGRLHPAVEGAERLAELVQRFGWEEGELLALFNAAATHDELRNSRRASELYLVAARRSRAQGQNASEVMALFNAARLLMGEQRNAEADELLRIAQPNASSELLLHVYSARSHLAMLRGRDDEAAAMLEQAREIYRKRREDGVTIPDLANLHVRASELHLRAGRREKALEEAMLAMPQIGQWERSSDTLFMRVGIMLTVARALDALGRRGEAIERLRQGLGFLDEMGSKNFDAHPLAQIGAVDAARDTFELLIELLVETDQTAEALRVSEQMRARGLRAVIARGHVDLSASMSDEDRKRENELEQQVVELNRRYAEALQAGTPAAEWKEKLGVARGELDAFRLEMRVRHPAVARRRVESAPSPELPESWSGITAVEYVVTKKQTIAFIVERGRSVRAVRLPLPRETVAREAHRFATEMGSASLTYREPARRLYDMLLAPLEPYLGAKTLCIIPDVELWRVAFHALLDERGRHVVEGRAVFYAQSISFARDAAAAGSPRQTLLALGNPTIGSSTRGSVAAAYRDVTLGALADAETEVKTLGKMYSAAQSRVYFRDAAREALFKAEAPEFRVLHIAAHAIVDDAAPLYSAIVLAAGRHDPAEDGLLEAREVVDLPLSADLAVLSACETARGKVGAGEGVVGLAWAFFAAGCPTTVVSQWKAESHSTSQLMIEFHRRLLAGDSPAAALRAAQLELRKDPRYRHPFFWAPFAAIGAAGRPAR